MRILFVLCQLILGNSVNQVEYQLKFYSEKNDLVVVNSMDILSVDTLNKKIVLTDSKIKELRSHNYLGGKVLLVKNKQAIDTAFFFEARSSRVPPVKYFLINQTKLLTEKSNTIIYYGLNQFFYPD